MSPPGALRYGAAQRPAVCHRHPTRGRHDATTIPHAAVIAFCCPPEPSLPPDARRSRRGSNFASETRAYRRSSPSTAVLEAGRESFTLNIYVRRRHLRSPVCSFLAHLRTAPSPSSPAPYDSVSPVRTKDSWLIAASIRSFSTFPLQHFLPKQAIPSTTSRRGAPWTTQRIPRQCLIGPDKDT